VDADERVALSLEPAHAGARSQPNGLRRDLGNGTALIDEITNPGAELASFRFDFCQGVTNGPYRYEPRTEARKILAILTNHLSDEAA
jgi:hypothetical protein